ncbi:MAG: hypothetical protein IE933_00595 [Sphingomonadales bacterium]|nr:hypothetical protein [Sphingomonadales bacterium]MBD3772603.1 hypothetical protein [Paracoccaceae bacterium]
MRRRTVLAAAAGVPLAALAAGGLSRTLQGDAVLVFDARLARGRAAAANAARAGIASRASGGEIAALLLDRGHTLPQCIFGVTCHAEMILAADVLRQRGWQLHEAMRFGGRDTWRAASHLGERELAGLRDLLLPLQGRGDITAGRGWIALRNKL